MEGFFVNWKGLEGKESRQLYNRANNSYCIGFSKKDLQRIKSNIPLEQVFYAASEERLNIGTIDNQGNSKIIFKNVVIDLSDGNCWRGSPEKELLHNYLFSVEPIKKADILKYLSQSNQNVNYHLLNPELLPEDSIKKLGPLIEIGGTTNFSRNKIYPIITIWTTRHDAVYPPKTDGKPIDPREDFSVYNKGSIW